MKLYFILMNMDGVDDHYESVHHIYKNKSAAIYEAWWQNEHTAETGRAFENYTVHAIKAKTVKGT